MHFDSIYFFYINFFIPLGHFYTRYTFFPLLVKIFYNTLNTKKKYSFLIEVSLFTYPLENREVSTMKDKVLA